MGMKINPLLLFTLSVLLSCGTGCQDTGRFAVSGKSGTLGIGGDFTTGITDNVNARVGLNMLDLDTDDVEIEDIEYDLGIDLQSFSALVDWHIFDDSFRISGGLISMNNKITLDVRPTKSEEIGGITYTPTQIGTLSGSVEIDNLAPYVGIGWGNPLTHNQRWGFTCDFGVAFTGSPDVALTSIGGSLSSDSTFLANLEKERRDIEDDLDSLKFYPVISLGLFFRF
jgi:hypothetical protein